MSDPFSYDFEDAFYGPLGEYTRRNEKRVEIDSLSLFLQLLTVVGNVIGRRGYTKGGPDRHNPNLFTLIVGDTSIGKGGSGTVATELGDAIDPGFETRTAYNVGSARALVQLVSDGLKKTEKRSTKDGVREYVKVIQEEVIDKRLLLFFPEMRATLVAQGRNGATLKDELKNAWDGRTIENNTKDGRDRATNPHIGLIGHITPYDLRDLATRADVGNGYFNRFLITVARHERSLPFTVEPPDCQNLLAQIAGAIKALGPVSQPGKELDWADDARDEWAAFYDAARQGRHPFIAGIRELGGRVCPLTKRVALIFAILEGASVIHFRHLRAGKAIVLEALNRSRHLFVPGKNLSSLPEKQSVIPQELRSAFANREGEWTKTDLHNETGNRRKGSDLEAAAAILVESGEWIVREGKTGNGHNGKFWSLAPATEVVSPEIHDPLPVVEEPLPEIEELLPDGIVKAEGIYFACGQRIKAKQDTRAYSFDGNAMNVMSGEIGYLAAVPPDTPPEQHDAAHNRLDLYPDCVTTIFGGEVLFVPWKAVRVYKEPVAA